MGEWEILDQTKEPTRYPAIYSCQPTDKYPHWINQECEEVHLDNAELLALACRAPEVRALVEYLNHNIPLLADAAMQCDPTLTHDVMNGYYELIAPFQQKEVLGD